MTDGANGMTRERVEWGYRSVILAALAFVGFFAQQTWSDMRIIEARLIKIEVELARNYVTREEFRDRITRIEAELDQYKNTRRIKPSADGRR